MLKLTKPCTLKIKRQPERRQRDQRAHHQSVDDVLQQIGQHGAALVCDGDQPIFADDELAVLDLLVAEEHALDVAVVSELQRTARRRRS